MLPTCWMTAMNFTSMRLLSNMTLGSTDGARSYVQGEFWGRLQAQRRQKQKHAGSQCAEGNSQQSVTRLQWVAKREPQPLS